MATFTSTKERFKAVSRKYLEGEPQGSADPNDVIWLLVPIDDADSEDNAKFSDFRSEADVHGCHRVRDTANSNISRQTTPENRSGKQRRKALRKRVRKHVWRFVRGSWKYLRRGMEEYSRSSGLAAMFSWGVNLNSMGR